MNVELKQIRYIENIEQSQASTNIDVAANHLQPQQFKRGKSGKIVWVIVLLAATGGFIFHSYNIVSRYYEYQLVSKTENDYQDNKFEFPSVTVCPFSFVSWEKGQTAYVLGSKLRIIKDVMQTNLRNFWAIVLFNSMDNKIHHFNNIEASIIEYATLTSLLPYAGEAGILNQPEDAIILCRYRGEPCNYRNFTPVVFNSQFCFRFDPTDREIINAGPGHGLTLSLYRLTNQQITKNGVSPRIVDKFYIHRAGTWPDENSPSEMVLKTWLNYRLTQEDLWRQSTPIRHCDDVIYTTRCHPGRTGKITCSKYRYTDVICDNDYKQRSLFRKCGCVSSDWLLPEDLTEKENCFTLPKLAFENNGFSNGPRPGSFLVELLGSKLHQDIKLIGDLEKIRTKALCFWEYRYSGIVSEKCPIPICKERYYSTALYRVSKEATQASIRTAEVIKEQLISTLASVNNDSLDNTTAAFHLMFARRIPNYSNFLAQTFSSTVDIQAATLETKLYIEHLIYSLFTFLSDIGGVIGLWIGISIVTVFEIIEYGGKALFQIIYKKFN